MKRMKVMMSALAVAVFALPALATTVDGELSDGDTVLTVDVASGEADFGTGHLSALTGNVVTRFVKTGAGTLTIPADVDISAYAGEISVEGGVYRILDSAGAGSTSSGDLRVAATAAFEIAPASGTSIDIGSKHVMFAGDGPDGKGALRCAAASNQDSGRSFGTNLEMTGDAVLAVTTAYQLSLGKSLMTWQLNMGGHTLELRPYVNQDGASDRNIRFLGSLTIVSPGAINVAQGNFILRDLTNVSTFGGGAGNRLTMSRTVMGKGAANAKLEFSKAKAYFPWTLVWDSNRNLTVPSTTTTTTTNENCWAGPVELQRDLRVTFGSNDGYQRFTFGGPVTGNAGISLETSSADTELNLLSDANAFTGPLVSTGATVRLWKSGALPVAGAGFVGTNATLALEGDDTYVLPSASFDGPSAVRGGKGRWSGPVVKTGPGMLEYASRVGGVRMENRGGTIRFARQSRDASLSGFISGLRTYSTYAEAESAYDAGEIVTNGVEMTPAAAYDRNHIWWQANALITFDGYIWNNTDANVTWSFVTALGLKSKLKVNGMTVCEDAFHSSAESRMDCGYGNAVLTPGANRITLWVLTKTAGQGPACRSSSDNPVWAKSNFGFVYDPQGRNAVQKIKDGDPAYTKAAYNYYQVIQEPGDGSLLTWVEPGASDAYVKPGTGETIVMTPQFDVLVSSVGTALDYSGMGACRVANLVGAPTIANCGTFAVTNVWTLGASSLAGTLTSAGSLDFTGCTLALPDAASVKSGSFVVATAEGGIAAPPSLPPALAARGWRLSLEDEGNSLRLIKNPSGFILIVR